LGVDEGVFVGLFVLFLLLCEKGRERAACNKQQTASFAGPWAPRKASSVARRGSNE
jgi:hypothetical protein